MIAGLTKGDKAVDAGKIGDQFEKHFWYPFSRVV